MLTDTAPVRAALEGFLALGVHLAVDDFGTGYASVDYLRSLPFDLLEVDRSHTAVLRDDSRSGRLARGVFALARETGLVVVAEGVETAAQQQAVVAQGCVLAQGYLYSRALDPEALTGLLQAARLLPAPRDHAVVVAPV